MQSVDFFPLAQQRVWAQETSVIRHIFNKFFGRLALSSLGIFLALTSPGLPHACAQDGRGPIGPVGVRATYTLPAQAEPRPGSVVQRCVISLGPVETSGARKLQWLLLDATKVSGARFRVWALASEYPSVPLSRAGGVIQRYLVKEGSERAREFVHRFTGEAVLPSMGIWQELWPKPKAGAFGNGVSSPKMEWLGQTYTLESEGREDRFARPSDPRRLELFPEVLMGVPTTSRTRDSKRLYGGKDYKMTPLSRADYAEMISAGMNCFRVGAKQAEWLKNEPVFLYGPGGKDLSFPECLFRTTYLGPALYLDEPAVHTRDSIIRPRLAKDEAFRQAITPQLVLTEFKDLFRETVRKGAPFALFNGLRARPDVDLGTMQFVQRNLYTWETMVASAAWQLTGEPDTGPTGVVFEPPGRIGTRRTLPEMNMVYGCEIPPENASHLVDLICAFLRGAARAADNRWGISIYGSVDQADAPWWLTHAYDLGGSYFFFWDNYQSACVPYAECVALAKHLKAHYEHHPRRNLPRLLRQAKIALLFPPGYDLGHVQMGRGNLWGVGELNLERKNQQGIAYRQVMGNLFTEIERCLRLGIAFDILWDLEGLNLAGYQEIVRLREDGRVDLTAGGEHSLLQGPRLPPRYAGQPPKIAVESLAVPVLLQAKLTVRARLTEGSAPIYYTTGADGDGVYQNAMVLWELYGPSDADYRVLLSGGTAPRVTHEGSKAVVETDFSVEKPGRYRLRSATTDRAGRSAVVWTEFEAGAASAR